MSVYADRAVISLHTMICEMSRKKIDISRIAKCAVHLLGAGLAASSVPSEVLDLCVNTQRGDGGWTAVADTIWKVKFLSYYPNTEEQRARAFGYLRSNRVGDGYGRSQRDIGRIPVTGLAFYLLPELADDRGLRWLEDLWESEKDSLTYKAAYTLMAFKKNSYVPADKELIRQTAEWLASQQEDNGAFAPWKRHPAGTDIYCTAVSCIGLLQYADEFPTLKPVLDKAYEYVCGSQLKNGIWAYHELEDGGGWGLTAMTLIERWREFNES